MLAGGLTKAGGKLVLAAADVHVAVLYNALFALLGAGFTLLSWTLLAVVGRRLATAVPLVLVAMAVAAAGVQQSTGPLLLLTIVMATATAVLAILLARRRGDRLAEALLLTQLALAVALVPLAAGEQTVSKQWLEQSLNAVAQGAFALAAMRLARPVAAGRQSALT